MKNLILKILPVLTFLSFLFSIQINAQEFNGYRYHAFSGTFVFTGEGGVTIGKTDYKITATDFATRLSGEYFFPASSAHTFGLGLRLAYLNIAGEENRSVISTKDGVRQIPPSFKTTAFSAGLGVIYLISVNDVFFPQASLGFSNLWFDPKDDQGKPASGNASGLYTTNTQVFNLDLGFRVLASDKLSVNALAGINVTLSDYIDDIAAAGKNDSYLTFMIGISYSPFSNADADGDGIKGSDDKCPGEPEDFDGFQDEDGCPDLDNDNDGIPDKTDQCPDEPEDIDGFQDNDGCPDLDNDGDGIVDKFDKCPDEAEDFDNFADLDGCPDIDNDGDGIPDSSDTCPNEAETFNGIDDEDGCPDSSVAALPDRFTLSADDIFQQNSAKIKFEAKTALENIINIMRKYPNTNWRIEGHMDSRGSESFIRSLSFERAKAVLEYLNVFGGLDKSKFEIFGMADNFPVGNNNTESGRKLNRRIEIIRVQ